MMCGLSPDQRKSGNEVVMDALSLLHERVSIANLVEPGPTPEQMDALFKAALRAPDHGALRPWRFLVIEGEARQKLGKLFRQVGLQLNPDAPEAFLEKCEKMPLRAPCLVAVVVRYQEHPKVPQQEQLLSAGAAAQNILLAAYAQGLGAIWRTGWVCDEPLLGESMGLAENERLVGFLYIGSRGPITPPLRPLATSDFVSNWS